METLFLMLARESLVPKIPAEAALTPRLCWRKSSVGFESPFYRGLIKEN